jgi:FixJ family two-component response regulator
MSDYRRFRLIAAVTRGLESNDCTDVDRRFQHEVVRRIGRLTRREREVAARLLRGLLNKEIASELGTTEKSIKERRGHVLAKLQVGSVAQLIRLVERAGRAAMLKLTTTDTTTGGKTVESRRGYSSGSLPRWRLTC